MLYYVHMLVNICMRSKAPALANHKVIYINLFALPQNERLTYGDKSRKR